MITRHKKCLFGMFMANLVLLSVVPVEYSCADELGRLFTTPAERNMLEKLRHEEPKKVEIPDIVVEENVAEKEVKPEGGITINGLVYRKGGKSTAWINNSNTYEGDLSNQYLRINAENIEPEDVQVEIPGNTNNIKLKVGQTYDPSYNTVEDITDISGNN